MTAKGPNYGWLSTFEQFSIEEPESVRRELNSFVPDASREQNAAWTNSIPVVRDAARHAVAMRVGQTGRSVLLEYELPREGGRRPDAVLLENGTVLVVEFKGKDVASRADLDQVAAYARDLRSYHALSHGRRVVAALVPMRFVGRRSRYDDVHVLPPAALAELVEELSAEEPGVPIDGHEWAAASYEPLPGLVEAARDIFQHRPLPFIRQAQSAGIPQALEYLVGAAHQAAASNSRHLILLTGVPGAGKTLVGLQLAHDPRLDDLMRVAPGRAVGAPAVFLSGNGPLVQVLQHALRGESGEGKIFVNGIKNYLKQYLMRKKPSIPPEHIIVFDEAQRAWDNEMIREKHEIDASEPELVIDLARKIPDWSVVLGLVGEGQEIHKGEEGGISQWAKAVSEGSDRDSWTIHGPDKLAPVFASHGLRFEESRHLDLTMTLRSHQSSNVHQWVARTLEGRDDPRIIAELAAAIRRDGFTMYLTRDIGAAASFAKDRYEGQPDKRFGLIASARARNLEPLGIDNSFQTTKQLRVGPWYNDGPRSPFSCCQLQKVATEFAAQGLELDLPIVCWGDDLYHDGSKWVVAPRRTKGKLRNPEALRINSYRVLLTRGRDGFVVFVPKDVGDGMDSTAEYLLACGLVQL